MTASKYDVFIKVVESGSLTRAAEALGCTQSNVSHVISALEEELALPLLTRTRTGAKLTPEGEQVMPLIRNIVLCEEQLAQTTAAIRGMDAGVVRIATFTSVAVHWLPGMIKEFQLKYPNIQFVLKNGDYRDVDQWLSDGSADIGFVALPAAPKYEYTPLIEDRLLAILPPDHRLTRLERVPVEDVADEPFISLLEGSDNDARRALEAASVKLNVKFTTKDDYAIIAMVEQGLGVSIMPELLLQGRSGGVAVRELIPPSSRTIALALADPGRAGPAVLRFADYVKGWVSEHYNNR